MLQRNTPYGPASISEFVWDLVAVVLAEVRVQKEFFLLRKTFQQRLLVA